MSTILIKGGQVVDPANNVEAVADVFIEGDKIKKVGKGPAKADTVIDAKGLWVVPGLIDMHVHLREPGQVDKETIETGVQAAVAGGFTSIACMANTAPPLDNEAGVAFVKARARESGFASVFPIGGVTKGLKGEELAELASMVRGGAVAFSDDGKPLMNAELMRRGLEYASMFGKAIISHCEDVYLGRAGVVDEGIGELVGLKGMPPIAEEIMVARDILLAQATGGYLHCAHLSTKRSVELVRQAKANGVKVTCEVTPHHLTLNSEALRSYDSNFKMNPPLRTQGDINALIEGLKDGTVDAIASDHAPHTIEEKEQSDIAKAPFGVIGLETTLPVLLTELVGRRRISLKLLVASMTANPARILGIDKGTLSVGVDADVTLINPLLEWSIDPSKFCSKARNTPFGGKKVKGKAVTVIVGGKVFSAL